MPFLKFLNRILFPYGYTSREERKRLLRERMEKIASAYFRGEMEYTDYVTTYESLAEELKTI